ncbi:MAG TPA: excinuclease ABC subunit UvrA, partial [Bacteroidales bacterium]|nr:excinuclease ABC subunit UvrA [Bacteroidales bacterium]
MGDEIRVLGARVHNLKDIDVTIPRNKLVVITGLSGSGKSSLAFDTIYAEGQRRYMETLSVYARQFLGGMERPDVDKISGLSPVISIEQKSTNKNPRSTVGTITEIYDFLRLLYARAADAYSWVSGEKMVRYTDEQITD